MPRMRKRSAKITNVRFRKSDPAVKPYWTWIENQDNLKLSVIGAIQMAQDKLGDGDLRTALISLAEHVTNGKQANASQQAPASHVQAPVQHESKPATAPSDHSDQLAPKPSKHPVRSVNPFAKKTTVTKTRPVKKNSNSSKTSTDRKGPTISNDVSGQNDAFKAMEQNLHPHQK